MFHGLVYCARIEHGMMKILHGALIIAKGTKICSLYILDGLTIIVHASLISLSGVVCKGLCSKVRSIMHFLQFGALIRKNSRKGNVS